jgi:hypothetical protein
VLLELTVVEQRFNAVMEVLRDGLTVTDVAERYGVSRPRLASCCCLRRPPSAPAGLRSDEAARALTRPPADRRRSRPGGACCSASCGCVPLQRLISSAFRALTSHNAANKVVVPGSSYPRLGGPWTCLQTARGQPAPCPSNPASGRRSGRRVGGGPPGRPRRCRIGCRPAASVGWWPRWS